MKQRSIRAGLAALGLGIFGWAHAAIDRSSSIPGQTTSEMVFVAYDPVNQVTYIRDLGTTVPEFRGFRHPLHGAVSWLEGFDSFLGRVDASQPRWALVASDSVNPVASYFTIDGRPQGYNPSVTGIVTINSRINTLISHANSQHSHASVADGWSIAAVGQGGSNPGLGGQVFGPEHNLGSNFVVSGLLTSSMSMYGFTQATTAGSTRTLLEGVSYSEYHPDPAYYNGRFFVSGNYLMYTDPVPEPGTYALMLAGLLTLGAVARRRR